MTHGLASSGAQASVTRLLISGPPGDVSGLRQSGQPRLRASALHEIAGEGLQARRDQLGDDLLLVFTNSTAKQLHLVLPEQGGPRPTLRRMVVEHDRVGATRSNLLPAGDVSLRRVQLRIRGVRAAPALEACLSQPSSVDE